jgi:hypothetical protein
MKIEYSSWRMLLNDCVIVMLVSGTIGIALKFTTLFDHYVYFPAFPNIFDAIFLIVSVVYLAWKVKRK